MAVDGPPLLDLNLTLLSLEEASEILEEEGLSVLAAYRVGEALFFLLEGMGWWEYTWAEAEETEEPVSFTLDGEVIYQAYLIPEGPVWEPLEEERVLELLAQEEGWN